MPRRQPAAVRQVMRLDAEFLPKRPCLQRRRPVRPFLSGPQLARAQRLPGRLELAALFRLVGLAPGPPCAMQGGGLFHRLPVPSCPLAGAADCSIAEQL